MKKRIIKSSSKKLSVTALGKHEHENAMYDRDYFKWTKQQSELLKSGEFKKLDIINLIEEIESLGKSQRDKLESYLTVLLMHKLKIKYQPARHSKSWDLSVKNAQFHSERTLKQNPSLKSGLSEIIKDAYYSARLIAAQETGLDENTFPETSPWHKEDIFPQVVRKATKKKIK